MRVSTKAALERDPEGSRRVGLLELFFDLVYVVALALISRHLAAHHTWTGALQSLLLLMAMWWVWSITAFLTDLYDPQQISIKLITVTVMLGSLLMASTLPRAFTEYGLIFACAYVGIHFSRGLFLVPLLHGQKAQGRAIRIFFWFALSAVPWILGGLADDPTSRAGLWALALALDYGAFSLGYPTPLLGRLPKTQYNVTAEHLAERYQQFIIIALGDAILVIGLTFSRTEFDLGRSLGFVVSFASTLLLWRIYSHRAGEVLPLAIGSVVETRRFFQVAPYTHLAMVGGIVVTAAGFEIVLHDPVGNTGWGMVLVLLGGPVLFLVGRSRFEYEVFGRVSLSRIVALLILGLMTPAMIFLPPVAIATGAMLVLAGMAAADTARSWGRVPEQPSPPV
ncbi:low temperature requirement protein A [Micromonospora sp. NBC_01796]|uniref:low temperature requirement protein A n=1 Tax=Micromonospora sp. NBC_01796 TaxID=2975987 RepID=UPI002DDBC0D5|nr:low temperature requirement protein A [Micromonospora sp. NBC_01796]WSA89603.1 low temperature requirement protein A [Micromonospora sp. NBC_01796]